MTNTEAPRPARRAFFLVLALVPALLALAYLAWAFLPGGWNTVAVVPLGLLPLTMAVLATAGGAYEDEKAERAHEARRAARAHEAYLARMDARGM